MPENCNQKSLKEIAVAVEANQLSAGAATNVKRWLTEPQYAQYAESICQLIDEKNFAELDRLFWEVIAFGTGGRRGPMSEFGSATMNPRTIAESAHGLATYLKQSEGVVLFGWLWGNKHKVII